MQANVIYRNLRQQVQQRAPSARAVAPILVMLLILAAWQGVTMLGLYPEFIIPTPRSVIERFFTVLGDGRLLLHTWTTTSQMLAGLALGLSIGILLGYAMAKSRALEDALSPLVLAFQSTPVVAYAPLLVIWFGSGPTSKVITSALIVFFPMLMNTIVGIRTVPISLRELMRSLRASRWQTFAQLEVPAALPVLFGGLKVSVVLAVIGAVVGEFVSSDRGLGFLINIGRGQYDTALVFVAIFALMVLAMSLYGIVVLLENRTLKWRKTN